MQHLYNNDDEMEGHLLSRINDLPVGHRVSIGSAEYFPEHLAIAIGEGNELGKRILHDAHSGCFYF